MSDFRGNHGLSYEQLASCLETSEEVLWAIEQVAGGDIEEADGDARTLWANGGRDAEILAALSGGGHNTVVADDGETLYWADAWARWSDGAWVLL